MQYANIYSVATTGPQAFVWRWRTHDGLHHSSRSFPFYFDCVEDARREGYEVRLEHASGPTAPDAVAGSGLK